MDKLCLLRIYYFTGNKHSFILLLKTRYFYPLPADEETETHGSQALCMSKGLYMRSHIFILKNWVIKLNQLRLKTPTSSKQQVL